MKKSLIAFIACLMSLASCNGGKSNEFSEETDSITLRTQTDTILSFNGVSIGDTIMIKDTLELDGQNIELATPNRKIQVRYWYNGDYLSYPKPEYLVSGIYVDANISDVKELLELYMSRYGKFSYFKRANDTQITSFDDKIDSLSRSYFLTKYYQNPQGIFVWEWANCSITFEVTDYVSIMISYIGEGYNKRLEEVNKLQKESQKQDI